MQKDIKKKAQDKRYAESQIFQGDKIDMEVASNVPKNFKEVVFGFFDDNYCGFFFPSIGSAWGRGRETSRLVR